MLIAMAWVTARSSRSNCHWTRPLNRRCVRIVLQRRAQKRFGTAGALAPKQQSFVERGYDAHPLNHAWSAPNERFVRIGFASHTAFLLEPFVAATKGIDA